MTSGVCGLPAHSRRRSTQHEDVQCVSAPWRRGAVRSGLARAHAQQQSRSLKGHNEQRWAALTHIHTRTHARTQAHTDTRTRARTHLARAGRAPARRRLLPPRAHQGP
jgi:hypothetical protein